MVKSPEKGLEDPKKYLSLPNVCVSPLSRGLSGDRIRCGVCERRCILPPNHFGFCGSRINIERRLYTVVYGDISSISANPIEKKPPIISGPEASPSQLARGVATSPAVGARTMTLVSLDLGLPVQPILDWSNS